MKLNFDNAFASAKILIGGKEKFIYKVNKKSFYAGDIPADKLEQPKEMNFTDFMKKIGGTKYSYATASAEIDDTEIARKDNFISKKKKQKEYLTAPAEAHIKKIYKNKVSGKSPKSYKELVENGKGKPVAILEANESGWFFISKRDGRTFFFYNVFTNEYKDFDKSKHEYGKLAFPKAPEKIEAQKSA